MANSVALIADPVAKTAPTVTMTRPRGPQRGLAGGSQGDLLLLDEHAGAHQRRRPEPFFVRFPCEPDVAP